MKDKLGREFARVADVKAGRVLVADGGFDCLSKGQECLVEAAENGRLFVRCSHRASTHHPPGSRHYLGAEHGLDGQYNDAGTHYIGLYPKE